MLRSGGFPSKPRASLSGCSNIASTRFRLAAAADEDRHRRLTSSLRQHGVAEYTSSQTLESRSLSWRGDERFSALPRKYHAQLAFVGENTHSRRVRRSCSAM